ncbi:MAG: DsrE family protein [Verrucomicrobiae bacterium]|nr:DsrE family protein [Verrucomicrobiae bacterium]
MKTAISILALPALALIFSATTAVQSAENAPPPPQKVVVHLSHFGDNLHAVNMALKIGTIVAGGDAEVVMFVDLEGVRLADSRQPNDLKWGTSPAISELLAGFLEAGGSVLVCPHCAAAAGLAADDLRKGAKIAEASEIADLFLSAQKVIDY